MSQYFRYENNDFYDYEIASENTNDTVESYGAYYQQLKSIPQLKRKEELRLYQKYLKGDEAARDELIESQLNMVVEVAKLYTNRGVDFDDLVQEGNLVLVTSIEKYEYKPNLGISSFARQEIHRHLRRYVESAGRLVRIPSYLFETIEKIKHAEIRLSQILCRRPTYQDISTYLHMTYDEVRDLYYRAADYLADEDEDTEFKEEYFEYLVDPHASAMICQVNDSILHEILDRALRTLTPRENFVLRALIGFDDGRPKTLEEVGSLMELTRERIRQIEKKALRKMRHPSRARQYKYYQEYHGSSEAYCAPLDGLASADVISYSEIRNYLTESRSCDAISIPTVDEISQQERPNGRTTTIIHDRDDEIEETIVRRKKNHYEPINSTKDLEHNLYSQSPYNIEYSCFNNSKNALKFWVMNLSKQPIKVSRLDLEVDGNVVRNYNILGEVRPKRGRFFEIPIPILVKKGRHEIKAQLELSDEYYEKICKSKKLFLVVNYDLEFTCIQ